MEFGHIGYTIVVHIQIRFKIEFLSGGAVLDVISCTMLMMTFGYVTLQSDIQGTGHKPGYI
jgi:hypothetical protein